MPSDKGRERTKSRDDFRTAIGTHCAIVVSSENGPASAAVNFSHYTLIQQSSLGKQFLRGRSDSQRQDHFVERRAISDLALGIVAIVEHHEGHAGKELARSVQNTASVRGTKEVGEFILDRGISLVVSPLAKNAAHYDFAVLEQIAFADLTAPYAVGGKCYHTLKRDPPTKSSDV